MDTEERSHVEIEDEYIFVVINIPVLRGSDVYDAVPLGVFVTEDFFITICLEEAEVLYPFLSNQMPTFYTFKKDKISVPNHVSHSGTIFAILTTNRPPYG